MGAWLPAALTAASYFFYGYIQPYYVVLLFLLTLSDYAIGLVAGRFRARWHGVLVSFIVNFGALAYFKYANFGLDNARAALDLLGFHVELPRVTLLLPIGISFHIFQSFAYVMDVLDGRIAPCRNFVHYALYVSWFPQLVAGPIERPGRLLPQLAAIEAGKAGFTSRLPHAAALFAEGWIRKIAADVLSTSADAFFDAPAAATELRGGVRDRGLRAADLRRLQRLQPDGPGDQPRVRRRADGELRPAVRGPRASGSSGGAGTSRCPPGSATTCTSRSAGTGREPAARARQHPGHDAPERPVARGGLDLHRLGGDARRPDDDRERDRVVSGGAPPRP